MMNSQLSKYGQYKKDFFTKLGIDFISGKKMLDVGCGDGIDAEIFIKLYKLKTYGIDVYKNENIKKIKKLHFSQASIYKIPFPSQTFDYVFMHDVLHHIDEDGQRETFHLKALKEIKRVVKNDGIIVIAEGNRYNPLFYPHMVKVKGHEHFRQSYFKNLIKKSYKNYELRYFEAHLYPHSLILVFKLYEFMMEHFIPKQLIAYNVAIIRNNKKI